MLLFGSVLDADERLVGDLDGDGEVTVLDLARQLALVRGRITPGEADAVLFDLDRDGVTNDADTSALVNLLLGTDAPAALPLATVRETSPLAGQSGVALTREFVVHFTLPLGLAAVVTTHNPNSGEHGNLYAQFGGRRLLTRAELSSDRRKATLFFLEPLPASARVRVTFDSTGLDDVLGRAVDGDGDGLAGGEAYFDFDTLGIAGTPSAGVVGTVYGVTVGTAPAAPSPLAGVTITVDGAEQTLRVVTGADGRFALSPAPVGRFFVLIDGRTATNAPGGGYYAFVGKAWEGIAGRLDTPATPATGGNAPGDIFLPFIPAGTLQAVSATQDTTVTFAPSVLAANPQLAGVQITVPANSLFADNGARGGSVGIAPVAPDKLPEPLPPGLAFPLVITVQTDGATNFDRPVPVRFPNLPDPRTGMPLAPGAKTALWSFNHDTGEWEVQGPMTVSEDGLYVVTDPGVGIRQPGWHGWLSGVWADLKGLFRPPKNPCDVDIWKTFKDTVAGSWKAGLDCGLSFLPGSTELKAGIACASSMAEAGLGLWRDIDKLQTTLSKLQPGESPPYVDEFMIVAKNSNSIIGSALGCAGDYVQAKGIGTALNCANAATSVITSSCGSIADAAKDRGCTTPKSASGLCTAGQFMKDALTGIDLARNPPNFASGELNFVKNATEATRLIGISLDRIDSIRSASGSSPDGGGALALGAGRIAGDVYPLAEDIPAIVAELEAMKVQANILARAGLALEGFYRAVGVFLQARDRFQAALGTFVAEVGEPTTDRHYYVMDTFTADAIVVPRAAARLGAGPADYKATATGTSQVLRGPYEAGGRLVLPAESDYRLRVFDPVTGEIGEVVGTTGRDGQRVSLPGVVFFAPTAATDPDGDGLAGEAEAILGTDPALADTDGDGVNDGAEARAGTNPLDGRPVATGIIASVDTPGDARDVAAANGLAAIADSAGGVVLFTASDPLNPVRIAQVDTPGTGAAVAFGTGVLAVADGAAGLAVVDVTDPPAAGILHQLGFGSAVNGVVTDDVTAHVALANGFVASVDLVSGTILERRKLATTALQDVALGDGLLYAYTPGTLYAVDLRDGRYGAVSSVPAPGPAGSHRLRLSSGGDRLFQAWLSGVNVFSLAGPLAPVLLQSNPTTQAGWKQLVPNGSGLALGAVGANSNDTGPHEVSLYRIQADGTLAFQTTFVTPGIARAVAIHDGLGYVADGASGLQVINYLPYDNQGQAPTITLTASFPLTPAGSAIVEEGKSVRATAIVADDVQVRHVQFLVDGELVATDGGFPFEVRFTTPLIAPGKDSLTLQARAFDTGGNTAATPVYTVALVPDATPPEVKRFLPAADEIVGPIDSVLVTFSEPLDLFTVTPTTLEWRALGPDRAAGTIDDVVLAPPIFSWRETSNTVAIGLAAPLAPGVYRVSASSTIADLAGNPLRAPVSATFTIFSQADRDRDGVPDDLEALLGMDPDNPDSDGDGIVDGREDNDGDGLSNAAEIALATNPQLPDTNGNGITDADEDADGDSLTNVREAAAGTDIAKADTDGDGWNDEAEVSDGTDPLDATVRPPRFAPTRAGLIGVARLDAEASIATARAGTAAVVVLDAGRFGPSAARPPTAVVVLSAQPTLNPATEPGLSVAQPPVQVQVPPP